MLRVVLKVVSKPVGLSLVVLGLAGCGSVPMFVDMGDNQILRGSASGRVGSTATFTVSDAGSSITCSGAYPFNLERTVSGTITCSDGKTGKYLMSRTDHPAWRGEGQFDDGKTFRIFINYASDPDKR